MKASVALGVRTIVWVGFAESVGESPGSGAIPIESDNIDCQVEAGCVDEDVPEINGAC